MNDTVGKFYKFRQTLQMPQSGKVIKPGVSNPRSGGIRVCALKGRREADLPTFPAPLQGAKINNNSNLG
ncbi:MAG: hypothetical protein GY749_21895, partial [Desulfobacteraceae bacterium]|nr:hypothetical protein [Desulfobacteraceae bacterium]